jgi:hypothetical protein
MVMLVRLIRSGNPAAPPAPSSPYALGSPTGTREIPLTWEISATDGRRGLVVDEEGIPVIRAGSKPIPNSLRNTSLL